MNAILVKGKSLENDGEYEEAIKLFQNQLKFNQINPTYEIKIKTPVKQTNFI